MVLYELYEGKNQERTFTSSPQIGSASSLLLQPLEALGAMAEHLPLLLRHYASLTPTVPALLPSPPFPSSAFLSLPSTQQYLVDHLLSQGQDEGAQQWRRSFWKRVVRGIEDGTEERRKAGDEAIEDEVRRLFASLKLLQR